MRSETVAGGIIQSLRAALTRRRHEASMEVSPSIDPIRSLVNVEVTPGDVPGRSQYLNVKNLGKEAFFHATAQIVSSQNSNSFLAGVYPLGWGRDRHAWAVIPKGEIRQISIATIDEVYTGSLFHIALIQAGPSVERHWARWNAQDKLPLPRFGLKVAIIAEGAEEPWTGYFTVTPENKEGIGVRVIFRGREGSTGVL